MRDTDTPADARAAFDAAMTGDWPDEPSASASPAEDMDPNGPATWREEFRPPPGVTKVLLHGGGYLAPEREAARDEAVEMILSGIVRLINATSRDYARSIVKNLIMKDPLLAPEGGRARGSKGTAAGRQTVGGRDREMSLLLTALGDDHIPAARLARILHTKRPKYYSDTEGGLAKEIQRIRKAARDRGEMAVIFDAACRRSPDYLADEDKRRGAVVQTNQWLAAIAGIRSAHASKPDK
ncbi:hypothetical protein [Roseomonas xinghualingensis]|uniref:hypothetical protein n=1 Tax=Roseomonas xinghualingensis TaxID=2986475 RepID=UPI0021F1A407|nr:hypothetical protein [Roseomonas sp. SXEYE001]MCV4209446.1 hypothetical protein [Roseomonas sp. SXEYE001]